MRVAAQDSRIALLQERNGFQVFLAALYVLFPLAIAAVVIEIQHAGHCVHTQAVHMVLLNPEQRTGYQEAFHFRHTKVEHHGAPLFMLTAAGVGVLIAGGAVKHVQAVSILGEVGGHPVQDHTDTGRVQLIHKLHKVVRGTVTAGGGKVTADLIAPAAVKRIFRNGQQLHMGIAHIFNIRHKLIRQFGIIIGDTVLLHFPAASMQLVDAHRAVDHIIFLLRIFPCGIVPVKAGNIKNFAAVGRAGFGMERIRVSLVHQLIRRGGNAVFINIIDFDAGNEQLPNAV